VEEHLMPWPSDHKERTRRRIVDAAASEFRARGLSPVRVEDIMGRAGLTHGGFYAHFASKDELMTEALERATGQTLDALSKAFEALPADQRLGAVIDAYLSPGHVAHPEAGCPVAALGPEVARAGGVLRRNLARDIKHRLAWMRRLLPRPHRRAADDAQVIGTLACMVGGLILARSVGEKDAPQILNGCRRFLHETLDARNA
jgi:TetR/AcrR family transcriptional repressor of nem operon